LTKEFHANEKLFKIPVELEEPNHLYIAHTMSSSGDSKRATKLQQKIEKQNQKLQHFINSIKYSLYKLNFFESYCENPAAFIKSFLTQRIGIESLLWRKQNGEHNQNAEARLC
jgi:hypothetical protein